MSPSLASIIAQAIARPLPLLVTASPPRHNTHQPPIPSRNFRPLPAQSPSCHGRSRRTRMLSSASRFNTLLRCCARHRPSNAAQRWMRSRSPRRRGMTPSTPIGRTGDIPTSLTAASAAGAAAPHRRCFRRRSSAGWRLREGDSKKILLLPTRCKPVTAQAHPEQFMVYSLCAQLGLRVL